MGVTIEKSFAGTAFNTGEKGTNLFFYDANLEGLNNLLPYIDKNSKTVPIKSSDSFFTKLLDYSSVKINNLYLLCHGKAGELKLGSELINASSILSFSKNNHNFKVNKLTLLSCNVGKNINFIETLSEAFKCEVNYSDKLVGHKSLGGSWDLKTYLSNEIASNNIVQNAYTKLHLGTGSTRNVFFGRIKAFTNVYILKPSIKLSKLHIKLTDYNGNLFDFNNFNFTLTFSIMYNKQPKFYNSRSKSFY